MGENIAMASTATNLPSDLSAADRLVLRRSPMPDALVGPGPSREEVDRLVEIALRVPDHGRLSPWRLVLVAGEAKDRWVEQLLALADAREDAPKVRVSTRKLASAPLIVVVVSAAIPGHKVPEWEQHLSAGAVCMNLLNGAHALGYGANWLTGWHAYDAQATALLGLEEGQKVAGVVLIGSIAEEAPPRPRAKAEDVARWL
jgi:nitroreductase